jgi:multidrug efflux pump
MTLTLASVFAPLAFATGRTGRLFIEFALTLAGAVMVSGFIALTLTPMMCSLLLKHERKHSWLYNKIEAGLAAMTNGYRRVLAATLRARWVVVILWFVVLSLGGLFFTLLKSELSPTEDRGVVFGLVTRRRARRRSTRPIRSSRSRSSIRRFPRPPRTRRSPAFRRWWMATRCCA